MSKRVILPFFIVASLSLRAQPAATNVVGARPGYTFDVEKEKDQHDVELVLIEPPPQTKTINERLFDEKTTKDIRDQYEYRFGHTAMEQTMNAPQNRDTSYFYNGDTTVTADQYEAYQRSFGTYVGRKAVETQADNFFKTSESMKGVYKYKDKLTDASVETKSGYKFKWHYNISGNSFEMTVENPYHIETKMMVQVNQEETLNLGYQINPLWRVSSYYKFEDGVAQLVVSRKITSTVSGTITGSTTTTPIGPSIRQNMALVGISWTQ